MSAPPIPDTFWTTREELALFGGSCLLGLPAGVLFDCFRLARRMVRHPTLAVAVEDTLWLVASAVMLLCYASACAKGVFRAYYAAGCFLGFLLYEMTLGVPAIRLLDLLWRFISVPFRWLGQRVASIFTKTTANFVRCAKKCLHGKENTQNRLQETVKRVYNIHRYQKRGIHYGKSKTSGQSSAARSEAADAVCTGTVHRCMRHRIRDDPEFDRRKKERTCRAGEKNRNRHRPE